MRPCILSCLGVILMAGRSPAQQRLPEKGEHDLESAKARLLRVPLTFEPNRGQSDPSYRFQTSAPGQPIYFANNEVVLTTGKTKAQKPIHMSLVGANATPDPELLEPTGGHSNYYIGNDPAKWQKLVPQFRKLKYNGVYPGIDVVYYGSQGKLEYDFIVQPGANSSRIELSHAGADKTAVDANGDLVLSLNGGELRQLRPVAYQSDKGRRREIDASYRIAKDGRVRFHVGRYNHKLPLVIDPVLAYFSYLGADYISAPAMAIDASGYVYVAASNYAAEADGVYIAKLNPANSSVVYSTDLVTADGYRPLSISVDGQGRAYVVGGTESASFPVMDPFQFLTAAGTTYSGATLSGSEDAFVTRLDSLGQIDRSSYLGGSNGGTGNDWANLISVASDGSAVIAGSTVSPNFPFTTSAGQSTYCPNIQDGCNFEARIDSNFNIQSVYYDYYRSAFARDANNNFYEAECNYLAGPNFAIYLGGTYSTNCTLAINAITVDSGGNVYVAGAVSDNSLPAVNAFQASNAGGSDAFAAKIDSAGSLVYSTYLGGTTFDSGSGIAVDSNGNIFVAGTTESTNFPTANGQTIFIGSLNLAVAFVAELNPTSSPQLVSSTFLDNSNGYQIVGDANDNFYLGGLAFGSVDLPLNTTVYGFFSGPYYDPFIAKLSEADIAMSINSATVTPGPGSMARPSNSLRAKLKSGLSPDSSQNTNAGAFGSGDTLSIAATLSDLTADSTAENPTVTATNPPGLDVTACTATLVSVEEACSQLSVARGVFASIANTDTIVIDGTAGLNVCSSMVTSNCAVPGNSYTISLYGQSDNPDPNPSNNTATITYRVKVPVTIATSPTGLQVSSPEDATSATAPLMLQWDTEGSYSFSVPSPQSGPSPQTGVQYVFSSWSNGPTTTTESGVVPAAGPAPGYTTTYTAYFNTQYQLTVNVSPPGAGSVTVNGNPPAPWYNASAVVPLSASANSGYAFAGFTATAGSLTGTNPASLTMSAPSTVTANFNCLYSLDSSAREVSATASTGFSVNVTAVTGCMWTATSNAGWLTITSGASGNGVGTVNYSIAANTGSTTLVGTLTIAGLTYTVTQLPPPSPQPFTPITPCRVADTRPNSGFSSPFGPPSLVGGATRNFPIPSSGCGVPSTAQAYSLNITVVPNGTPLSYLTAWATGSPQPTVATLNDLSGVTLGNAAIVPAGTGGAISLYVTSDTDVIIDINGYFAPADAPAQEFYPMTPCRIADTRGNGFTGDFGPPSLVGAATRVFPVLSSTCDLPAAAEAYSLRMTVAPPGPLGYLTAFPDGQSRPVAATVNDPGGVVLGNQAIVPAGTNGAIDVYASANTNLIIDINGYFAPPGTGGLNFYPLVPCRVADTRGNGFMGAFGPPSLVGGASRDFPMPTSPCGIPSSAQAYSLNLTIARQSQQLYLTAWPTGQPKPVAATLNAPSGPAVGGGAIVPAGTSGSISVFVPYETDLIIDINGYFAP
jgi:hypothetical protein